jgi:parvulin-like peptidyl-prolyl isomerase
MLKILRNKKTAKKVWIVLAILIVPAFIFWGSSSVLDQKGNSGIAGRIFGKGVSFLEYGDSLQAVRNQALIQFGENFQEVQKYMNLEAQAWERLILLHEAKKYKINVSDAEVVEAIESYPFFQRKDRFDNKTYLEMLRYVFHAQPRAFEEQTRNNLILSKFFERVTDKITIDEKEVKAEYKKANEEVSLHYLAELYAEFAKGIEPTEQEVKDFFTGNQLEFKQPLSFSLEYVVSDSELKLKKLRGSLDSRSDFAKAAQAAGLELKETGLFAQTDPIPEIGWSPEILGLLSQMKINEFTPLITAEKKFFLLRLKEKKEAYIPEFEKIKEKAKDRLIRERTEKAAKEKTEACLAELKKLYQANQKPADFNRLAAQFGLKANSTELFKFGSYIEGLGSSDPFWLAAQGLKEGDFSEIIATPSGLFIVRLKSRIPVDEKKFEEEKETFTKKALLQKKQESFMNFLEELKKKAVES